MNLFSIYNVKNLAGVNTAISSDMSEYIDLWNKILTNTAPWNDEAPSCGLPLVIAGALADPIDEEINVTSENEKLAEVMRSLDAKSSELVQNIVTLGGSLVRPIYANGKVQFEIIKLGNYIPTSYDFDGTLNGAIVLKKISEGKNNYLLLEKIEYKNKTQTNAIELYKIEGSNLRRANLTDCSKTAELTPAYTWENIERPFIVEIRNRKANNIDGSGYPCALYAGYENLIEDADRQYARLLWEVEATSPLVFADSDLFRKTQGLGVVNKDNADNVPKIPTRLNKLFVKVNGNGSGDEKIKEWAPPIRTAQQLEAFNEILRRLELACNIGKGTLSNLTEAPQTATQYTGGKKALYSAVDTIESELEEKYKHLAYIFAYMLSVYEGEAFNDEIEVTFNDAARKDPQTLKAIALQEVNAGIMSKAEYREKFYGEDAETAAANVPEDINGGFVI